MLSVFDLLCNGLRDPRAVVGEARLSWRLGSDRQGARQASFRVMALSLDDGEVLWDSGETVSEEPSCVYGGRALHPGEVCSWFVSITDDAGNQVQSLPAVFWGGDAGDVAFSDAGPQRLGFVWTSDDALSDQLDEQASDATSPAWRGLLGVSLLDVRGRRLRIAPTCSEDLLFAQGSLLLAQGLLVVRWERVDEGLRLEASLPPGVTGELCLGAECRLVGSGRHALEANTNGGQSPCCGL